MSIEKLYPYANDHAIQSAAFVVEWAEPLTPNAIEDLAKLKVKFRGLLPDSQPQNVVEFNLTAIEGMNTKVRQELGGIVFSRQSGHKGVPRSLTISKQNCVIVIPDYSRWDQVWSDVQQYLEIVLEQIGPLRPLSGIGLQYTDLFNWKDAPSELDVSDIFLRGSYLPENVFQQKGLWHSHHGFMEAHEDPTPHKRLENINVDMLESSGERSIQIITSHRATMIEPMWQSHLKHKTTVLEMFVSLHTSERAMLRKLFAPALCQRINLVD